MFTEDAFGKLKSRFRVLYRNCESKKETVRIMRLAWVVLHKFDLNFNHMTNKHRGRTQLRHILHLVSLSRSSDRYRPIFKYGMGPWYKNSKCNYAYLWGRKKTLSFRYVLFSL